MTSNNILKDVVAGVPVTIPYSRVKELPTRRDFLDAQIKDIVAQKISKREKLVFMPITYHEARRDYGAQSTFYVFGILPCGSKTAVVLDNVPIYVDVSFESASIEADIRTILRENNISCTKIGGVSLVPLKGFNEPPGFYARVYFSSLYMRSRFIWILNDLRSKGAYSKMKTASDDNGRGSDFYFNKIAREYRFKTNDWNAISDYDVLSGETTCDYTLKVDVSKFVKLSKAERKDLLGSPIGNSINRDKTVLAVWDIETYKSRKDGVPPRAGDKDYEIFMICSVYSFHYTDKPFMQVCITNRPCVDERIPVTIVCADEREVLLAHAEVLGRMKPDVLGAFNGGAFDWPLYRDKMQQIGALLQLKKLVSPIMGARETNDSVWTRDFKSEDIKIGPGLDHRIECYADFPGMLDTDVMPVFLKMYPRAEVRKAASLNFFLQRERLESKEDLPYKQMFAIYERSTELIGSNDKSAIDASARDMGLVGYYCLVDCIRPLQLYVKRTVITDKRELATLSYTTLFGAFYRADGGRVCNLVASECHLRGVAYASKRPDKYSKNDKEDFTGAWVFPPNKGLHSDGPVKLSSVANDGSLVVVEAQGRPITGLDFTSLYPSLIMTYNLSPDMIVYSEERAKELREAGYSLHQIGPIEYTRRGGSERCSSISWSVRHNGVFDQKRDKRTIARYEKVVTESGGSRKISYTPVSGREPLPGERMGIFATIVYKIIHRKRLPCKHEFIKLKKLREEMELQHQCETIHNGVKMTIEELDFLIVKVNAKQGGLKTLANTFYGISGDCSRSIYELQVAAGITSAGQYNIKGLDKFVRSKGFVTQYGDTDSLYLSCPDSVYAECDAKYKEAARTDDEARLKWWTEQVRLSMVTMTKLQEEVSDYLLADNGTTLLSMAYEEVGFPTVLCGKKKYFMTPHIEKINFNIGVESVLIKGIDIVKQGQAGIAKSLGYEFIRRALSPKNRLDLLQIAEEMITNFYKQISAIDVKDLVLTARYKPEKKSYSSAFVDRIKRRYEEVVRISEDLRTIYEPPEPGDKYEYVIIKKGETYTLRGTIVKDGKSDVMELLSVYKYSLTTSRPLELDAEWYMDNAIAGLMARFIAYHEKFKQPTDGVDFSNKEAYSEYEKKCAKAAKKYIMDMCATLGGSDNKASARERGSHNRACYKNAYSLAAHSALSSYGVPGLMLHRMQVAVSEGSSELVTAILESEKDRALASVYPPGHKIKVELFKNAVRARSMYMYGTQPAVARLRRLNTRSSHVVADLMKMAPELSSVIRAYDVRFVELVEAMKGGSSDHDFSISLNDAATRVLVKACEYIDKYVVLQLTMAWYRLLGEQVEELISKRVRRTYEPSNL